MTATGADARPVTELTRALVFAAEAHANQRRKGAAQEPYVNHLIEVLDLVARATAGHDMDVMLAALLHDAIEDTGVTADALAEGFGPAVAAMVLENSDDMSLPKEERKRHRIAAMARKSYGARLVKTADVISNIRAVVLSAPAGWGPERKLAYLDDCRHLIDAGRGTSAMLETIFDETAAEAERAIRDGGPMTVEGHLAAVHELEAAIGQPVHLVYLANTGCREITRDDVEKLAALAQRSFPSCTIERADAVYEGRLRPILTARIRSDSSAAVVAFAQQLCVAFGERFVGIEVAGRYIRVYSDDTA
ncbi:MAG: bifunctional (p)ppGpp synthetase/guanosine-3',5'-bis(diphosphate) 3'-pyrophosphohydrolase [Mangrovicoccus sp.]|nr:bifunctional (p)ppGpp synthetase/guanosine-3',5'-bis(diphosphate) 3'-pyrophosphohydrolase [Mangrovicoccus sp.]